MPKKRFVPDPRSQPQGVLVIAAGRISGTYADHFHKLSRQGKTGYYLDRDPTPEEKALKPCDLCLAQRRTHEEAKLRGEGKPTLTYNPFANLKLKSTNR